MDTHEKLRCMNARLKLARALESLHHGRSSEAVLEIEAAVTDLRIAIDLQPQQADIDELQKRLDAYDAEKFATKAATVVG